MQSKFGLLSWRKLRIVGLILISLEAKMFPSVWLFIIFASGLLEGMIASLFITHSQTHIHSLPYFLHRLPFHCLFFLTLPVKALCVNGTLLCFAVGPLQAQLCLTRAFLLSIDIDRASLCVSESMPVTVSLLFHLFSPLQNTSPLVNLCLPLCFSFCPPLHQILFFHFTLPAVILSWCEFQYPQ